MGGNLGESLARASDEHSNFVGTNQFNEVMARLGIKSTVFISSIFCLLMATNVDAQIGERIKERIKQSTTRKVEDKIVKKTDEKTDQALDSLFKERKRPGGRTENESSDQTKSSEKPAFNFGGMTNATYESSYTLEQEFKIEIKSQEKKKKQDKVEVVNMDMFYGENCYMAIVRDEDKKASPKSLMDLKNNTTIMLNDEDMSAMAMSMDFMTGMINDAVTENQDSTDVDESYSFKKTGKSKMIAGYMCDEYLIENDDMTMNVWYTDDITIAMHQNMEDFAMFASFSAPITAASKGELVGTMMESHMVEKTGDEGTFDYLVKEVNLETTTLNMSDYKFTKMGGN